MEQATETSPRSFASATKSTYQPPRFRVISLDCEISSYAPDDGGETPLF